MGDCVPEIYKALKGFKSYSSQANSILCNDMTVIPDA